MSLTAWRCLRQYSLQCRWGSASPPTNDSGYKRSELHLPVGAPSTTVTQSVMRASIQNLSFLLVPLAVTCWAAGTESLSFQDRYHHTVQDLSFLTNVNHEYRSKKHLRSKVIDRLNEFHPSLYKFPEDNDHIRSSAHDRQSAYILAARRQDRWYKHAEEPDIGPPFPY